jgi:hypothetical protein
MKALRSNVALKPEREGILAVLHEPSTIDRIQGVIRELQTDDELSIAETLDSRVAAHWMSSRPPKSPGVARAVLQIRVAGVVGPQAGC